MRGVRRDRRGTWLRWGLVVAVYAALLLVAELLLYAAFRIGLISSFTVWTAPLQLLPLWLLLGWWTRRQGKRPLVVCSLRARAPDDERPGPWRRGQARLSPGLLRFSVGTPGSRIAVPAGPEETIRVDRVAVVSPTSLEGLVRVFRPVVVVLSGADGEHELKIGAADLAKVQTTLVPAPAPAR